MLKKIGRFLINRFREPSTRAAIGAGVAIFAPDQTDQVVTAYDGIVTVIGGALLVSAALGNDDAARVVNEK